jgi:proton glutamate symport protein
MNEADGRTERQLVTVRIPAGWTLAGLIAGLLVGIVLSRTDVLDEVLAVTAPLGALWLRALQATIVPLVAGLLVIGIAQMALAARAGAAARRMLVIVAAVACLLRFDERVPYAAAARPLSAAGRCRGGPIYRR